MRELHPWAGSASAGTYTAGRIWWEGVQNCDRSWISSNGWKGKWWPACPGHRSSIPVSPFWPVVLVQPASSSGVGLGLGSRELSTPGPLAGTGSAAVSEMGACAGMG
jgi:hypothetical protein